MEKKKLAFETLKIKDVVSGLETDEKNGLTSEEAKKRLEKFGKNKLEEKKKDSIFKIFFSQFNDGMIFVLLAATLVTIVTSVYETIKAIEAGFTGNYFINVGDWPDVIIILAVIIMNAIIGTVQEVKAQTSLDALKKMSSPESTVIRDGKKIKIKSEDLVVGDLVVIEDGDTVGADLRLIESKSLKCNESSLTGESVPVEKDANILFSKSVAVGDRINLAYMSTPVSYGRGLGVVVATGMDTQIGKIAKALDEEEDNETPLQKSLDQLGKILGYITIGIIALILVVDIVWIFIHGKQNIFTSYLDAVLDSIALGVAAIPEGLSAVVTIVLSIGVQRMVQANTIVRKLPSVETLGCVSVVCSDKTGTLTQNKMTVLEAYTLKKYYTFDDFNEKCVDSLKLLASGMSLCSNASIDGGEFGDPTEIALVVLAKKMNMDKKDLEKEQPRIDELPFDSERKMMSTMHKKNGENIIYCKGALDNIISNTTEILDNGKVRKITKKDIEEIYKANEDFSKKALRVLALCYKKANEIVESNLIFVGLIAMIDPARPEAKPAIEKFKTAGITTVMITGDHKDTAFAIAKELGIANSIDECILGKEIDGLSDEELSELCKKVRVFARVSPQNKVDIVKAFQRNGNICAMTGDGVNDAPSLKAADIGIAMGITGTDVAKGAADMVLTDDNFASIEKAVEEGRGIYANIRKTVLFLLSSNVAEVLAMFFIIIVGLPSPLIAIHLLWVNLVTDSLPAIALGMDPKDPNNMLEKPRKSDESLFSNGGIVITAGYGAVITIAVLIAYFFPAWVNNVAGIGNIRAYYEGNRDILLQAQSMAFCVLSISELFHMVGMSNPNKSFIHIFENKNYMMAIAFFAGLALQLFVIEAPFMNSIFSTHNFDANEWIVMVICSLLPLIVHEIYVLILKIKTKGKKNA